MTRVPLIRLCHRVPLFMPMGRAIPVDWYYHWIKSVAPLIGRFSRHAREQQRYIKLALAKSHSAEKQLDIARGNLIYRKWRVCLQVAWPNVAARSQQWLILQGEENLTRLARAGKGAILLCGHSFGFSGMAVRALAQRGYELVRAGAGRANRRAGGARGATEIFNVGNILGTTATTGSAFGCLNECTKHSHEMPYYNSASEVFRLATSQTELKVFTGRSFSTGKYSGSLKSCKFPCCRVLSFATKPDARS